MALFLKKKGFCVNVISAFPYYPQWKIWEEYTSKPKFIREEQHGINIYRHKQYVPKNPNFIKRIFMLLSFTYGAYINSKKIDSTDVVVAVIPYFTSAWIGKLIKNRLGAKLWVHVQDFEFDAIQQAGISNKSNLIKKSFFKLLFKLESYLLNSADRVSTISYAMLAKLKIKSNRPSYYLPNWIDLSEYLNPPKTKHTYLKSEKFKILYSGNIGEKQNWHFFLEVILALDYDKFEVVLIGNGAKKEWLEEQLKDLPDIQIYEPVPYSELSQLLQSADAHILFQKTNVLDSVMPSKLLGMMASGKPSLVLGNKNSEIKKIINDSNAGIYLTEESKKEAISAFEKFYKEKTTEPAKYNSARTYVLNNFDDKAILNRWVNEIKSL